MVKAKRFDWFMEAKSLYPLHSFPPVSIASDFSTSTVDAIVADAERACSEAEDDGATVLHDQFTDGPRILALGDDQ